MTLKKKLQIKFAAVILLALVVGLLSYPQITRKVPKLYNIVSKPKINLGLDLQGGAHIEYKADTSQIDSSKVADAMQALQDVISRRVNAFGVAEPVVYVTKSGNDNRLIVELAGVKDIESAKSMIKATPFLEFKEPGPVDDARRRQGAGEGGLRRLGALGGAEGAVRPCGRLFRLLLSPAGRLPDGAFCRHRLRHRALHLVRALAHPDAGLRLAALARLGTRTIGTLLHRSRLDHGRRLEGNARYRPVEPTAASRRRGCALAAARRNSNRAAPGPCPSRHARSARTHPPRRGRRRMSRGRCLGSNTAAKSMCCVGCGIPIKVCVL